MIHQTKYGFSETKQTSSCIRTIPGWYFFSLDIFLIYICVLIWLCYESLTVLKSFLNRVQDRDVPSLLTVCWLCSWGDYIAWYTLCLGQGSRGGVCINTAICVCVYIYIYNSSSLSRQRVNSKCLLVSLQTIALWGKQQICSAEK